MNEPPNGSPINILLVDDHQLVVEGLKMLLKSDPLVRVVGQANSGADALHWLRDNPAVHVALVDLHMPHMSGVELTRAIRTDYPAVKVLALSVLHDHASVMEVLTAGGVGYLLKDTNRDELSQAIRQVAAGYTYFSPEVGATLLQNLTILDAQAGTSPDKVVELTAREQEVLQLIAREYSNLDIANELNISERTVETHRKNLLTKTSSKSVIGLVRYALRHRLVR